MSELAEMDFYDRSFLNDRVVVKIEAEKEADILFCKKNLYRITPDRPLDIPQIRGESRDVDWLFNATQSLPEHEGMKGVVLSRILYKVTPGVNLNFHLDDHQGREVLLYLATNTKKC